MGVHHFLNNEDRGARAAKKNWDHSKKEGNGRSEPMGRGRTGNAKGKK